MGWSCAFHRNQRGTTAVNSQLSPVFILLVIGCLRITELLTVSPITGVLWFVQADVLVGRDCGLTKVPANARNAIRRTAFALKAGLARRSVSPVPHRFDYAGPSFEHLEIWHVVRPADCV